MGSRAIVRRNRYHDSVALMALSRTLAALPGVDNAVVIMGSDRNKDLLAGAGLLDAAARSAGPEDLIVAIEAARDDALAAALAEAEARLHGADVPVGAGDPGAAGEVYLPGGTVPPRSLAAALRRLPNATLALVSVPGEYAAREARRALNAGLHVMLFSDNVSLAEEVSLKQQAVAQGLLLMGPDCGSAILEGVGLGFANAVSRGPVGIVAASGTGLQEVSCLLDRLGTGVSHAIGTGGRDLSDAVGGLMMTQGIRMLAADPGTRAIVLIAKSPHPAAVERVAAAAAAVGKPVVRCFGPDASPGEALCAGDLSVTDLDAAALAAARAVGASHSSNGSLSAKAAQAVAQAAEAAAALSPGQAYVRGLYAGGTLCGQAVQALTRHLGEVHSNVSPDPLRRLTAGAGSRGHSLWDLGDDAFTVGRPHPLIEPALRLGPLRLEAADPETAVLLLDLVLGYGTHADPAGVLAPAIGAAQGEARVAGRSLAVVCSVTGTDADPQRYSAQVRRLQQAGAIVAPTAWRAALCAAAIAARRPEWAGGEG